MISHDVRADRRYTLVIVYGGTPQPVPAPTKRSDFDTIGWTTTPDGEVWTMQEPYGAYSWYAVNDQPSDKALYSFTISAPAPLGRRRQRRAGLAQHRGRRDHDPLGARRAGGVVPRHDRDRRPRRDEGPLGSGVPITYWTPRGRPGLVAKLREAPAGLAWLEERLGPFPFGSLGFLIVDSDSGMETQTMITLGDTTYATSPEVLVHEMAHQWYGDQVTPADWRDVWMNEGMAMYLQGAWMAEAQGTTIESVMDQWADGGAAAALGLRAARPTTTRRPSAPATSTTAPR